MSKCIIAGFALLILSCGGNQDPTTFFDIQLEGNPSKLPNGTTLGVAIKNKKDIAISKVTYFMDGEAIPVSNGKITLQTERLGNKNLTAKVDFEDGSVDVEKSIKLLSPSAPQVYTYEIKNTFPHDPASYTQGLEFANDTLFESTGKRGGSKVRKIDFTDGSILAEIDMEPSIFGEGITLLNDKLFHLTWKSGIGYVYNPSTLEKIKNFSYGESREGWGLCNDGAQLYKSDGTEKIWTLNPETLEETGYIETVTHKSIFNMANELEYVDGKIYANVYQKESMMIIDATSGAIEGVVNFGGLKSKVTQGGENWDDVNSVLNGVAYHPERGTFFVTGKNWDKMFEVTIFKKP